MKVNIHTALKVPATNEERVRLRPIARNTEKYQQMLRELEEMVVFADELGYDSFSVPEHHLHNEGLVMSPNSMLLYSKLAAMTKQIAFMPHSMVLPARNPIHVAEDIAIFDNLYPGRVKIGFARGYQKRWMQTLMQTELAASSVTDRESDEANREIFNEHLDIVMKALTEDAFRYEGKHFKIPYPLEGIGGWAGHEITRAWGAEGEVDEDGVVQKVGVIPAPLTKPHPEMFIPVSGSPATMIEAARRGFTAVMLESKPEKFAELCRNYQRYLQEAGHEAGLGDKVGAVRLVALGNSFEEAMEHAANTAGWDFWNYFGKFGFMEPFRMESDPPGQFVQLKDKYATAQRLLDAGHLLAGTPDDVRRQVEDLHGIHGNDGELDWFSWTFYAQGNVGVDEQKRQLELFADKVLPDFR